MLTELKEPSHRAVCVHPSKKKDMKYAASYSSQMCMNTVEASPSLFCVCLCVDTQGTTLLYTYRDSQEQLPHEPSKRCDLK